MRPESAPCVEKAAAFLDEREHERRFPRTSNPEILGHSFHGRRPKRHEAHDDDGLDRERQGQEGV
jgi:hypothetical protein